MENRLPLIPPAIGNGIIEILEKITGRKVDIILMVFPHGVDKPQPAFITSYPPDIMESIIQQTGAQMTEEFLASRSVVKSND